MLCPENMEQEMLEDNIHYNHKNTEGKLNPRDRINSAMIEDHRNGMDHAFNCNSELIHYHSIVFTFVFAGMLKLYKYCLSF